MCWAKNQKLFYLEDPPTTPLLLSYAQDLSAVSLMHHTYSSLSYCATSQLLLFVYLYLFELSTLAVKKKIEWQ